MFLALVRLIFPNAGWYRYEAWHFDLADISGPYDSKSLAQGDFRVTPERAIWARFHLTKP